MSIANNLHNSNDQMIWSLIVHFNIKTKNQRIRMFC